MRKKSSLLLNAVLMFIVILIVFSTHWFLATFDELSLDEIIFHLKVPMTGSNNDFLIEYIKGPFLMSVFVLIVFIFILIVFNFVFSFRVSRKQKRLTIIILMIASMMYSFHSLNAGRYLIDNFVTSTLYEEVFVSTKDKLVFPEKKRNLIYIYLESFESTFTSVDHGGALQENALGKMVDLAEEHVHFSNNDKIGGVTPATGTSWTVAGMVAQTSGIHLKLPIDGNSYGKFEEFLPGVISLGDILHSQGYNQTLLIGSDADFGGRRNYFTQHGNYMIKDYNYALTEELIASDYNEWWGYEDEKLFEFAKIKLRSLASQKEPFNMTMLTADTHHVGGYVTQGMKSPFNEQYKNVILNSSKQVHDFVSWVQDQEFYENTTIIIVGDHLTMDAGFIERNVPDDFERRIFNVIVNSSVEPTKSTFRDFASFDMFPTTLASMGVDIEGDRLGLGTNLFSDKDTVFESLGIDYVNAELSKKSNFYLNSILKSNTGE